MSDDKTGLPVHKLSFGSVETIANTDKKFGSNPEYELVVVRRAGTIRRWLLTPAEISRIEGRAEKNPEDWLGIKFSWFQWLLIRLRIL